MAGKPKTAAKTALKPWMDHSRKVRRCMRQSLDKAAGTSPHGSSATSSYLASFSCQSVKVGQTFLFASYGFGKQECLPHETAHGNKSATAIFPTSTSSKVTATLSVGS